MGKGASAGDSSHKSYFYYAKPKGVRKWSAFEMIECISSRGKVQTASAGMRGKKKMRQLRWEGKQKKRQATEKVEKKCFCQSFSSVSLPRGSLRRV